MSVVDRLARLRGLAARQGRAEAARLRGVADAAVADEARWVAHVLDAVSAPPDAGGDASAAGLYALHGEMRRRELHDVAEKRATEAVGAEDRARALERDQKIIEKLAERRAEREAVERRRKEQRELDEVGTVGWWRGRS